jgi:hypothetical protein
VACLFEETGYRAGSRNIVPVIAEEDFRQGNPLRHAAATGAVYQARTH